MGRVFVTGLGVVSSLGEGRVAFWESLTRGQCRFSRIETFDTAGLDRSYASEVKDFRPRDYLTSAECRRTGRCSAFALAAARMAVQDASLTSSQLSGERTAVIVGTTMGEADIIGELEATWFHHGVAAVSADKLPRYGTTLLPIHIARAFDARGMVQTLPAACAAGNYAIGFAADQIRAGRADVAIAGASEILQRLEFAGFVRLGAMAKERCQPFDKNRQGLILGEGAGMLILESERHVLARDATPLAEVGGYGLACDAHHITRPHPEGAGSLTAMRAAIRASGITPAEVDFVNAHGTGTHANDAVEARVVREIFGPRALPVSSMKGTLGHCMGAASALEAVACVLTVMTGIYPPTVGYETPDPECDVHVVADRASHGPANVVLNNALAFGGYDAVLALARPGYLPESAISTPRPAREPGAAPMHWA